MNPFEELRKTLEEVNKIHEQGEEKGQKFHEEIERIRGISQNTEQEIGEVLSMPEEESRKGEQERNDQKKETVLTEEQLQERMKTVLTEEEQQEYIRLRNIEAIGKLLGKELSKKQKQRLEEIERKLGGNDSNDAGIEDTKGGELSQEEATETGNSIEDLNELTEALSKKRDELKQVKEHYNEIDDKALKLKGNWDELNKKQEGIRKKLEDYISGKGMSQVILDTKPLEDELIQLRRKLNDLGTRILRLSVRRMETEIKIITKEREIRVIKEKIEELGGKNNMHR